MSSDSTHTIAQWLDAARLGNAEAQSQLLGAYQSYLTLLARLQVNQHLRGRVAPSDVVQDVLLRAQQRFGEFRGTTEGELLAWLRRILASRLVSLVRYHLAHRRDARLERHLYTSVEQSSAALVRGLASGTDTPSRDAMRREQSVLLAEALDKLPPDYCEVIVLRHLEGKSFSEIAALMSRSVPSVKSIWTRAVSKLRVQFSED